MFEVSLRPWRPRVRAGSSSERSGKLILAWITVVAVVTISFLCLSWLWASVISVLMLFCLIIFTWYYLQHSGRPVPAETVRVEVPVRRAVEGGLSPSDIAEIASFAYQRTGSSDLRNVNGEDGDVGWLQCAVCICTVKQGEMVRRLPACRHVFHVMCIDEWLRSHLTCPMCRADVKSSVDTA